MKKSHTKKAIISDQLAGGVGGAESIILALLDLYPSIPLYTTVYNKEKQGYLYNNKDLRTSFIQKLPFGKTHYKAYFPLMPVAVEMLDLQEYDVIISSHHSVAKGIIPRPDAVHICYCHSPARYLWDSFWTYTKDYCFVKKLIVCLISQYLRMWDVLSVNRVDYFLVNSSFTAERVKKFYNVKPEILHPPVDTEKFNYESAGDYYLMAGRLVSYKGYELAVGAFNKSGKKLIVAGGGPLYNVLKAKAKSNVEIVGRVSDERLVELFNNCKGFVFPGKEDFGIVMAEAQAAGKPVIAYGAGGALDIIENNKTGILYDDPSVEGLIAAIDLSEKQQWDHQYISQHAKQFDVKNFKARLKEIIENAEKYKR